MSPVDVEKIGVRIAELRPSLGHDEATRRAFREARAVYRADAEPVASVHAQVLIHRLILARSHGIAKRPRRMPSQRYPREIEANYAERIIAYITQIREAYRPLAEQLPDLVARMRARRGDAVDASSVVEDLARGSMRDVHDSVTFAGLPIVVENPIGSFRSWIDHDGSSGFTIMKHAYGFIADTLGDDGEEIDVYLGPNADSPWVFEIQQNRRGTTEPDEKKVMLGFASAQAATNAYHAHYDDPSFFGGMVQLSIDDFRSRLAAPAVRDDSRMDAPSELEIAKKLLAEANTRSKVLRADIEDMAGYFARETSKAQRAQLARQLEYALGIDVITDEQLIPDMLDYFTHENATLIESIPEGLHREMANLVARAFNKRMNPETLAAHIEKRFDVAESRARFIARDQLGKLWGQLNAVRQRGIGVKQFIWGTMEDDVVRPMHAALEDTVHDYDNPPIVNKEGDRMLPGEDYGCRCHGNPVLDEILAEAQAGLSMRKYRSRSQFLAGK